MNESKISQHLARRDGELELVSDEHEEDAALLESLAALKSELNSMPDVDLGPRDWHLEAERLATNPPQLGARTEARKSARAPLFVQYPMTTAATVLLATALFVTGIGMNMNGSSDGVSLDLASADLVTANDDALPALIARSQDLENIAQISGSWSGTPPLEDSNPETALTRLILMQVAAIDDRLSNMEGGSDPERVRMLWQRRVNLLEAYNAAIEKASPDLRRSM